MKKWLLALALACVVPLGIQATQATSHAGEVGITTHKEFNAIYFAERLSEWENWANVDESDRINVTTSAQDAYIYYYVADFADMPRVRWVELHVVRGIDDRLYIRPWKGIIKSNPYDEVRYQMECFCG